MPISQAQANLDDPKQMFAWMFAAGIPDARGEKWPNQPMVPAVCFPALSQMLYDFGCRFDPTKQTKWVGSASGPDRNFQAWGTTTIKPSDIVPDAAAMLAEIAPEEAAAIAKMTPEKHQEALAKSTAAMLASLETLRAATETMNNAKGGAAG